MNYSHIAFLFLQGTLVAFIMFLLFHFRRQLGIGVLFACMVFFQFIQVFLSSDFPIFITDSIIVSPGSSIFFTAIIFALLVIFVKEGAAEATKAISALLAMNVVMVILIQSFSWGLKEGLEVPFNASTSVFENSTFDLIVGSLVIFVDSLLVIVVFKYVSKLMRFLFLRILLTMLIVVSFDTLLFSLTTYWNYEYLNVIIISGLISRAVFSIFYSVLFYFYLRLSNSIDEN